jgi:hypothetical protein
MIFTLAAVIGAFIGGGVVGAGSYAAFKGTVLTKAEAEYETLKADLEAEVAKASPDLAALVAKVKALLAKL